MSGKPKLKRVVIDGVDVSNYVVLFKTTEEFDQTFRNATIGLKNNVKSILDFTDDELSGKSVTIQRGVNSATERYLFRGVVRKTKFKSGKVIIDCEDKLSLTRTTTITTTFRYNTDPEAGVISELFKTLINNYTNLTADDDSVVNSGTSDILEKLDIRSRILSDILEELANSIDYQYYYDPTDDKVYFEPKGYKESTKVLMVGDNVVQVPKWQIDESKMFNKIKVIGDQQTVTTTEGPYQLDGSQSDWNTTSVTLSYKPVDTTVYSDTNATPSTEKVGGIENSTDSYDYSIDTEKRLITWNTDNFSLSTSYYAKITYTYKLPINVVRSNPVSISKYSDGIPKEKVQKRADIITVDDAERWAQKQLNMYSFPFFSTKLSIREETDLDIGRVYTVTDNINNINRNLMIKKIKYSYPYKYDEVWVADKEYRTANWGDNIPARIRKLEEKFADNDDLVNQVVDVNRDIRYKRRYTELQKRELKNTGWVWGVPETFTEIDTAGGVWGDVDTQYNSTSVVKRVHGDMIYYESCYDTDFYDSSSSTDITFDTSNRRIDFSANAIYISNAIDIGTTLNSVILNVGTVTGTLKYEISSDNKSTWQEISTLNLSESINTSDGTGTYLRITETAGSTATIEPTANSSEEVTYPAINLEMIENDE